MAMRIRQKIHKCLMSNKKLCNSKFTRILGPNAPPITGKLPIVTAPEKDVIVKKKCGKRTYGMHPIKLVIT